MYRCKITLFRSIILFAGIRYSHSEFGGRALYPGFDPVDDSLGENRQGDDCNGHGTGVASIAAGNQLGVAKNATIYSVRVLKCDNSGSVSVFVQGVALAVEAAKKSSRPSVISLSLGGKKSTTVNEAVEMAISEGIPVVVTAGNGKSSACSFSPGSSTSAITVGGTAYGDRVYLDTNGGSCVDIFAPGELVLVADYTSVYGTKYTSGTSFAAPIVSGVAAIYLQERPSLSVQDLKQLLIDTSLKEVLNFDILVPRGLAGTTSNRFVQVKNSELSACKEVNN